MDDLSGTELRRALSAAYELAELRDLSEFPACVSRLLRMLIPCEHAGYNAIDVPSARASVIADPPEVVFEGGADALAEFAEQNPIIVRAAAGDTNVLRLSDHLSRRELHRTELYDLVYRRIGLEYQLGIQLPPGRRGLGRPDEFVGLSLCRTDHDFGDGDRALLAALQPLFSATLARLHELALLRATAAWSPSRDETALLVDRAGVLAWASPTAAEQFDLKVGERLPAAVQRWLAGAREAVTPDASPTVLVLDGRPVWPRLVRDAYPELDAIHLLRVAACPCQPQELRALGLTRRQSEVLALVMEGLTSREIAERLTLSPRTVETHVAAIYASLGVHNRSQALLATMQRLAV